MLRRERSENKGSASTPTLSSGLSPAGLPGAHRQAVVSPINVLHQMPLSSKLSPLMAAASVGKADTPATSV